MKNGPYELVIAPGDYPGRRYRGRYCYEHHLVWWRYTGETIEPGNLIHHINGDRRDNRFENLEKRSWADHTREHTLARGKTMVRFRCPTCGDILIREKRLSALSRSGNKLSFCSQQCVGRFNFRKATPRDIALAKQSNVVEIFKQSGVV